jgi:hypothetical protein
VRTAAKASDTKSGFAEDTYGFAETA